MSDDGGNASAEDWRERAAKVLPTEHFTLQSARAATIADSSSRASIYVGSVSIALVALAFIGQASGLGTAFTVFGLVLFPSLFFLGFATFVRVVQSGNEDLLCLRGINRIRHFYLDYAPEVAPFLILSAHDDEAGVMRNMGIRPARWQPLVSTGGTVGVLNSVVAGAFFGLLADAAGAPLWLRVIAGIVAFAVGVLFHYRAIGRLFEDSGGFLDARFPSPSASEAAGAESRPTAPPV